MNSKKFWISGLIVAVIYFFAGWFFYGILMASVFMPVGVPGMRPEPLVAFIALSCLAYGLLMAFTYPYGYQGRNTYLEGLRFGVLFALIINLPVSLSMYAFLEMYTMQALAIGTAWEVVTGAAMGILTAKIYGSSVKAA